MCHEFCVLSFFMIDQLLQVRFPAYKKYKKKYISTQFKLIINFNVTLNHHKIRKLFKNNKYEVLK